jgi:AcrR family transcriptional regulator
MFSEPVSPTTSPTEPTFVKRGRGRPRTFSDEQVFRAVPVAITQSGFGQLTLASIAEVVGTTAQALIRRFGSKQQLIQQYLEWNIAQLLVQVGALDHLPLPPLDVLYMRAVRSPEQRLGGASVGGSVFLSILAFAIEIQEDPIAASLADRRSAVIELGIERLLKAAVERGDLQGIDPHAIARVIVLAIVGTHMRHATRPTSSIEQQVTLTLDTILAPYRPR